MSPQWETCPRHDWQERADSMFSNEYHAEVRCTKCGCPGEKDLEDGSVVWPAT